jgi:diguanylate cyclase (GGDEF)-like protein
MPDIKKTFPLKYLALIIATIWTVTILVSAIWNMGQHEKEVTAIIKQIGRASIERDKLYRLWNARLGGIYVPVTDKNQPNRYLTIEMTTRRDLTISSDLTLTMVNPAYMTRQVYELALEQNKISGHITSLNPVNPINRASAWEEKALRAVEQSGVEYSEIIKIDGQKYLRMLLPLRTDKSCLNCHAFQGYKEGDLRGGISISLPFDSFHDYASSEHHTVFTAQLGIWAIGLLGILLGYIALARGEGARMRAEEQILNLAHFDKLTGLVNRNLFQDRMTQALTMAKRQKKKVALLYIDLDRFKPINDNFGHEAGDTVLQEVARRLMSSVRQSDTVARIGGDEFVVVLQRIENKQDAAPLAQKIITSMRNPFVAKGREHSVGASIGISIFPDDGEDMDTLLKNADAAMYRVKNHAGGGFEFS